MAEPARRIGPIGQACREAEGEVRPAQAPRRAAGGTGEAALIARSAVFAVSFYVLFIGLMLVALPVLLAPRRTVRALARQWARASLWLLRVICGTRIEIRGLEHQPRGAAILAVKHQSFLETFALLTVVDDFSYVLKRELASMPLFGWYLRRSGQIAVERERHAGALPALRTAVAAALAAGRSIIIFPEGTRRPIGAVPSYKPGVALLCNAGQRDGREDGVPCTPVALNTGLFWPRRGWKRRPGRVVIEFLPPVPTTLGKREFMSALQSAIEEASDALVAEALATDPRLGVLAGREPS